MINDETPLAMLRVKDLKEIIQNLNVQAEESVEKHDFTEGKYVYGLKGIRDLFKISHTTAQKYKDTILKDAVTQHGRKIITDVNKAMKLFKDSHQ